MKALVLIAVLWTLRSEVLAIELFEFGIEAGDVANPKTGGGCGEKVSLEKPFPFYGEFYNQLWVCNNGLISFVDSFSHVLYVRVNNTIIALFASDIHIEPPMDDGNEIYWRREYALPTLNRINSIINENTLSYGFKATWAVIVTYYKVGHGPIYLNIPQPEQLLFNTFQLVLACDDNNQCVCLFIYKDIQWTISEGIDLHGWAGFRTAEGQQMLIPGSETDDVINWPRQSNVGVDGLFIYRVNLNGVECVRQISPSYAQMYFEGSKFELQGYLCTRQDFVSRNSQIPVVFIGDAYNVTVTADIVNGGGIVGYFPFWGKPEGVQVLPLINGIDRREAAMVYFIAAPTSTNQKYLKANTGSQSSAKVTLQLQWETNFWETVHGIPNPTNLFITGFTVLEYNRPQDPFEITFQVVATENSGSYEASFDTSSGSMFFQIDTENNTECLVQQSNIKSMAQCGEYPMISKDPQLIVIDSESCRSWHKSETNKIQNQDASKGLVWLEKLSTIYGCPENSENIAGRNDWWYADLEVRSGLSGWELDPCCGGTPVGSYCTNCRMNDGASKCIQSPALTVEERDQNGEYTEITVSNQCCYDSFGTLLLTEKTKGSGKMKKSVNSLEKSIEFFHSEFMPYIQCCEKGSTCELYFEVRPVVKGTFIPRFVVVPRGDPHFTTWDGREYTFNPLGVFVMFQTLESHNQSFSMHVSTRRVGNGTAFSGFVLQDESTKAEFFMTPENETIVVINGSNIDLGLFSSLDRDGVKFFRNDSMTEFHFKLLKSDVIIKVFIFETGILTLAISPPTSARGNLTGLLGNFDGNSSNDFLSKGGNYTSPNATLMTIHEEFGMTWEVAQSDWSFSYRVSQLIIQDIESGSPYVPQYTAEFQTEEQRQQAEQICGQNEQCLLDVALTGRIEFAQNAVQANSLTESMNILNAVAEYNRKAAPLTTEGSEMGDEEETPIQISKETFTLLTLVILSIIALVILIMTVLYIVYCCAHRCCDTTAVSPQNNEFFDLSNYGNVKF